MWKNFLLINIFLLLILKIGFSQIIVIDPGHNESDIVNCNVNPITGNRTATEVNTSWDVAVRLENMINNYCLGWGVEKTKSSFNEYKSIDDREDRANAINAGTTEEVYFLSIHCNAQYLASQWCTGSRTTATGTESFYCNSTYNSDNVGLLEYAQNINDNIILYGVWHDRGRCVEDDSYYGDCDDQVNDPGSPCTSCGGHLCVLDGLEMANCLNEIGFQDNDADAAKLNDGSWRHQFAYAYFVAFQETFEQEDDLGIKSLVLPSGDGEFTTNEEIKIKIRNYGKCVINFLDNPFTFQVNVVGPHNYTFTKELNVGELNPDYEMDVSITTTCNLSDPGEYCFNISIIDGNDGNDANNTLTDQCINSLQLINANFSYAPVYGDFPLRVSFTDVSTGNPTNWLWNFGDGGTSTEKNPSHIFNNPNTYSVSLKVSNSSSSSTKVIPVKLEDKVYASFTADKTSGAYPLAVKFTNTSQGNPTSFSWNFGDGGTSTLQSPSHTYASAGNFTVLLTVNKGVYSDVSDPLTINTSHPAVKISGRVIEVLNGIPGLKVKAIKSDDGTITSSTTTNTNGDYQLNVPYGWSGKILVEGGNGYTDYFVNFTNLTQDKTGIDLLVSKVELNIIYSIVEGTYYKFEAIGAPIGTTTYEWSYSDGTSITTSSWNDYHIFNCFTDHSVNYTISLIVYGDKTFTAKPIILNIPRCIDVTAVAINEECNLIPLGSEVTIIDNSYPVSDISKYNITWGGGNSEIWDTEICKGSNCYSSSHFIYRANCKTFKYTYKNAGHYSGYLEAYNLASQKSEPDYFTYDVVDCSKSITSSNLANAYLYTSGGIYYYYAGSYNLINLNAISNFINKNVAITACNNIILKPGISIKPNLGKKVVIKTSRCLDQSKRKSLKSIESESWEFEDIEYFNPNCNNYEVLTENDDILNSDVEVFPNPNMGEFKIVFKNSSNIQLVEIINSNGYLIQRKLGTQNNKYDFNISDNSSGLYLVKVYYDNKIETYKIIYH